MSPWPCCPPLAPLLNTVPPPPPQCQGLGTSCHPSREFVCGCAAAGVLKPSVVQADIMPHLSPGCAFSLEDGHDLTQALQRFREQMTAGE